MVETVEQINGITSLNNDGTRANGDCVVETKENDDHYNPSVRMLNIPKNTNGTTGLGFHLTRSKWDPYPWVSGVDKDSVAEMTGLKVGDCVLEVNSEDVLGMRIAEVANLVKNKSDSVAMLLWSTGMEAVCNPESLCCGPMPLNLERLSASMQTILAALECPICLDTIPPPVIQCQNGHLVCAKCRVRADKCPVCREKYSPGRSLIAEQVYNSLTDAFNMREDCDGKLRERIFGPKCKRPVTVNAENEIVKKPVHSHTHKFLAKIMGKATSVDNLSSRKNGDVTTDFNNTLNKKSLSLSSSEIFRPENSVTINRCPSANRLAPTELSLSQGYLYNRRPKSCNVSAESLNSIREEPGTTTQLNVPTKSAQLYHCPCGNNCTEKIFSINQHISKVHKIPIISFGTSSAEISLPPRAPVDNASLILTLDNYQFWLKLVVAATGDLFISSLLQGNEDESSKYLLEIVIRKSDADKILGKELITRNRVFSLESKSWQDLYESKLGAFYTNENIKSTFECNAEIILKASVKRIADL